MSFRALVLVGALVPLATAFSQSTQPLAALAVTVGLTPHHSVLNRARSRPIEFDAAGRSFGGGALCATHPAHWRVDVLVPVPLRIHAYLLLANRSVSDGAAEMAPKAVSSWSSNALDGPGLFDIDAPNDGQCGLLDVGAPSDDQDKPFAPKDNQCAPEESVLALPEAFELTEPVCTDFSRPGTDSIHPDTLSKP